MKRKADDMNERNEIKGSTFVIKLRYAQNNSLQGSVQWLEKNKTVDFRSLCELMTLLTQAGEVQFRSWDLQTSSGDSLKNSISR